MPATLDCEERTGAGPRGETECPISRDDIEHNTKTVTHTICGTTFCRESLYLWIESAELEELATCPICRRFVGVGESDVPQENTQEPSFLRADAIIDLPVHLRRRFARADIFNEANDFNDANDADEDSDTSDTSSNDSGNDNDGVQSPSTRYRVAAAEVMAIVAAQSGRLVTVGHANIDAGDTARDDRAADEVAIYEATQTLHAAQEQVLSLTEDARQARVAAGSDLIIALRMLIRSLRQLWYLEESHGSDAVDGVSNALLAYVLVSILSPDFDP